MRLLQVYYETMTDGPGLRCTIYLSGCTHHCLGCHNPSSWDPNAGIPLTAEVLEDIIQRIQSNPLLDGITISGGDPFYNPEELADLLRTLKQRTGMNIWCYTGYTIEYLSKHTRYQEALELIDVLVDGPFIQSLYDPTLLFMGSSNQRKIVLANYPKQVP